MTTTKAAHTPGLRCDMCHKPLKQKRFQLVPFMRPDQTLTVGPDCYSKAKKAEAELRARKSPEEIASIHAAIAKAAGGA